MNEQSSRGTESHRARRRPGLVHLAALFGYLLLTVAMTWPLVLNLTTAIPGDGFDGWQNYWNLWWVKVALVDKLTNPLITDLLYHPTGVSLYFHTLNPINGLATLPVQVSAGLLPAYNAVVFMAWTLSGYGVFLLTRWVLGQPSRTLAASWKMTNFAAFLAGAIYAFSPFHMAHLLGHMQVMSLQWLPFYILYLLRSLRAVQRGRSWLRDALMAALFLILVGLTDWYFVLYLALFTGVALLWLWLTRVDPLAPQSWGERPASQAEPSQASPRIGGRGADKGVTFLLRLAIPPILIGVIFALVLSPLLVPMLREIRAFEFMVRPATDLYILSASVMDFLVPNRLHPLFREGSFTWIGNQVAPISERTISMGYVALALAILGVVWRTRRAALWLVTGIFFFALALGPIIHFGNIRWADIPPGAQMPLTFTPLGILAYYSPLVRMSRSVSRYALMVQLSVSVLAGLGLTALLAHVRSRRLARLIAAAALVVILFEYWVAPFPMSPPDTPAYYAQLAAENPAPLAAQSAVLNLPMNFDRPGYLLYQTVHRKPLTVAYISRDDPRTLTERAPVLQHFRHLGPDILDVDPAAVGMTVLADLDVDKVVLDRYKMPGGREREYTTELATAVFAGIEPDYEDERLTAYSVRPPADPQPYPVLGELNWGSLQGGNSEDGPRSRQLVGDEAKLYLYHARPGTRLRLRYRTAAGAPLTVETPAGRVTLPASETASEAMLELGEINAEDVVEIILRPAEPGQAWVESVGLVGP